MGAGVAGHQWTRGTAIFSVFRVLFLLLGRRGCKYGTPFVLGCGVRGRHPPHEVRDLLRNFQIVAEDGQILGTHTQ